jgi:hypothetical protein
MWMAGRIFGREPHEILRTYFAMTGRDFRMLLDWNST